MLEVLPIPATGSGGEVLRNSSTQSLMGRPKNISGFVLPGGE
jgi:hypothetical protein